MSKSEEGCAYLGVTLIVMFNLAWVSLVVWGIFELIMLIKRS